jgi:type IV pilus assembly protein PilP
MTREALVVSLLVGFAAAGCDDVPVTTSENAGRVPSKPKKKAKEEADDADKPPPKVDFGEAEFAESDKSRDPFRSFERQFLDEKQGNIPSQRKVILEEYTVDQL